MNPIAKMASTMSCCSISYATVVCDYQRPARSIEITQMNQAAIASTSGKQLLYLAIFTALASDNQ